MEEKIIQIKKNKKDTFIDYLIKRKINTKGTYYIERQDLEKYFQFQTEDKEIKVEISTMGNYGFRCKIFGQYFFFFSTKKEIKEIDLNKENEEGITITFATFDEEDDYIKEIKQNKKKYCFELNSENKWKYFDLDYLSPCHYRQKNYRVKKIKVSNDISQNLMPFYDYYIEIDDIKVYNNFEFQETNIRNYLFNELEIFCSSKLIQYYAICGNSGSGKTTSLLFFKKKYSYIYPILYLNCLSIDREDITNMEKQKFLVYEIIEMAKALYIQKEIIVNECKQLISEEFGDTKIKKTKSLCFDFLIKLVKIFEKVNCYSIINIIIDQYSSTYDPNNEYFYHLNELCKKNEKSRLIIVSSMNNTCVSSNLKNSFLKSYLPKLSNFFIYYNYYGPLFEINSLIKKEPKYVQEIMEQFDNSALIYYKLKSYILKREEKDIKLSFTPFINEICEEIKTEIKLFYHIIYPKDPNKVIINSKNIGNIFEFLLLFKKELFLNYDQFADVLEIYPFKYIKTKLYKIDISHPEFLIFLPKNILNIVNKLKNLEPEQYPIEGNNNSSLHKTFPNYLEEFDKYLSLFKGNTKKYISFFSIEPLYKIIENCCKEIIDYNLYEYNIILSLYQESKAGLKGDLFEWILIKNVKEFKCILNYKFDEIIEIKTIVPYNFSIKTYSYRFLLNKIEKKTNKFVDIKNLKKLNDIEEGVIITTEDNKKDTINDENNIDFYKKKYHKKKDNYVFMKIKETIDKVFNLDYSEEKKILNKKSVFLNQLNSNKKYIDAGILIYKNENGDKLQFSLVVFQIAIKKEKKKLYNAKEIELILSIIKEHLEEKYSNLIIIEASYYYIIDYDDKDINISQFCKDNKIGCLSFDIKKKIIKKENNFTFTISNFSKFSSCFIFKNENFTIYKDINLETPVLLEEMKREKLDKIYKPLLQKDINIPDNYYIYKDLNVDIGLIKYLTNYSLLILCDRNNYNNIKYICITEDYYIDYISLKLINSRYVKISEYSIKLIAFLIPIQLRNSINN